MALTSSFVKAEDFDIYLLAGQSNMDGRGKAAKLSEEQRKPAKDAIIYYRNPPHDSKGWNPLAPGYSIAPGYKGKLPSQTFGPELGFYAAMKEANPARKFAFIKGSKGGSSLKNDWKPGEAGKPDTQGFRYREFLNTIDLTMTALKKDGHTGTLKGVLWHQGESDSKSSTRAHAKRLGEFISRLRADLKHPELPFIIGEVFDNEKRDQVRAALLEVSNSSPHCGFASAGGLKTWDPGTHFDAPSQLELGRRFAESLMKVSPSKKE